ncbi:helix-turn-helix domain-containing protein [Muricoccus radiodurans]|uniref:helix-turn-helix domain-containing protein n=1 Tax=Muricoccus radiodurans TaxID=2231721 RepID=UPI003CFB1444
MRKSTDASVGQAERKHQPTSIDVLLGSRVRLRRTNLGWSQETLGEALGIASQQLQRYESGANRIAASRLFEIARALDVPISFFFDGADRADPPAGPHTDGHGSIRNGREASELLRAYFRISDPTSRKHVMDLAKILGGASAAQEG